MAYTRMPPAQSASSKAQLARWIIEGRVLFVEDVPPDVAAIVFMPIVFGALDGYRRGQLERIAVFAVRGEDVSIPGKGVNGYPIFASVRVWRRRDVIAAQEKAKSAATALDAALSS